MADIGDKLRSAREAKGLSIADIEKATKIQGRYLTAIEQNDFDKLPGDFYVRAFIRQYAQIVGLDGKELLSEYQKDVPESKPDEYVENSIDNKSEEVKETTDNKKNLWKNYLPRIAIGLGAIVVILIVYFLYARLSSGGQSNQSDNNVAVSSQSSSSKTAKPVTKESKVKITKIGNNEYQVTGLKKNRKLEIKSGSQATSATISINGTVQYQQTLAAEQKHTMTLPTNATTVVVTFSNDTGSSVKIGGKRVPYSAQGASLSLTLIIGKRSNASRSSSTNSSQNNTSNNSYNSSYNNNIQSSSQRQSQTQASRTQSSTTQNNQSNQNNQNNGGRQSSSTTTQSSQNNNQ